jgi:hypothetical protein
MSGAVLHRPGEGTLTPAEIGAIASRHDFRAV